MKINTVIVVGLSMLMWLHGPAPPLTASEDDHHRRFGGEGLACGEDFNGFNAASCRRHGRTSEAENTSSGALADAESGGRSRKAAPLHPGAARSSTPSSKAFCRSATIRRPFVSNRGKDKFSSPGRPFKRRSRATICDSEKTRRRERLARLSGAWTNLRDLEAK